MTRKATQDTRKRQNQIQQACTNIVPVHGDAFYAKLECITLFYLGTPPPPSTMKSQGYLVTVLYIALSFRKNELLRRKQIDFFRASDHLYCGLFCIYRIFSCYYKFVLTRERGVHDIVSIQKCFLLYLFKKKV